MQTQRLKDASVFPSNDVLEEALGVGVYTVFDVFMQTVTNSEYELALEWRFYNDGKAWLGKGCYKKKTIFWLSVWEGYFKTSFFFTEKHRESVLALSIEQRIKDNFMQSKTAGRLIPLIVDIKEQGQIADVLSIIRLKKSLK